MEFLAPLPVTIPLFAAAIFIFVSPTNRWRRVLDIGALIVTAGVTGIDLMLLVRSASSPIVYWFGGWEPVGGLAWGISFVIDPMGAGLAVFAGVLTFLGFLYSLSYFEAIGPFYHTLVLIFLAAMSGFCLTGDLFNLFVFFELMGVSAYALTGYKIEDTGPMQGALNFSVMNSLGGFLVLMGIALVYGRTGALNMAQAGAILARDIPDQLVFISLGLLMIGFFIKAAIVPFHFWLPDAHTVAPTPVSVLFSGIMVELGIYATSRIYWTVYHLPLQRYEEPLKVFLFVIGGITAILGAVQCISQRHLKRLLAFSTISHMGLILMGVSMLNGHALGGAAVYLLGHGFIKGSLFFGVGILLNMYGNVDEIKLRGQGRRIKIIGWLFILAGLALAGFPPFGPFWGKAIIETAASEASSLGFSIIAVIASALTGGALLRAACGIFFDWGKSDYLLTSASSAGDKEGPETEGQERPKYIPWAMAASFISMLVLGILVGVVPGLSGYVEKAAGGFMDTSGYISAVVQGKHDFSTPAVVPVNPSTPAVVTGILSGILSIGFAFISLGSHRLPEAVRLAVLYPLRPIIVQLRNIHSGYVGDYALWLVAGSVIFLGIFIALLKQ